MIELKPCPLCGADAMYWYTSQIRNPWDRVGCNSTGITVKCKECGCTIPSMMSQERVAEAWNKRADEDDGRR